jgi:hypothetical protein
MAIRKKTTAESESVKAEGSVKAGSKSTRARNTAGTEATGTSDNKTAKAPSPAAATHKSSARKSASAVPAAESPIESVIVEKSAFDAALHHDEISVEAYHNWLRNGCRQDTQHQDWLAAIETVRARHKK